MPTLFLFGRMVKSIGLQVFTHSLRVDCQANYFLVDFSYVLWAHTQDDMEMKKGLARKGEFLVRVPSGWVCRQFPGHYGARVALTPGRPNSILISSTVTHGWFHPNPEGFLFTPYLCRIGSLQRGISNPRVIRSVQDRIGDRDDEAEMGDTVCGPIV